MALYPWDSWTPSTKRSHKVFFKSKSFKPNMTNWPCLVWLPKKLVHPTNKAALGVCYRLLCTNLEDGTVCTLSPNQNVHSPGKWYLSVMDNIFFEVKKCIENAFSKDLEIQIYWLSKQNSKKNLNLWEKRL